MTSSRAGCSKPSQRGSRFRLELAKGELPGDEPVTVEADIATLPSPATRVVMRLGGRAEVLIEVIGAGEDLYLRGGVGGAPANG